MTRNEYLRTLMGQKVLLLDGAMGTTVQSLHLSEDDYIIDSLPAAPGCIDLLTLTRSDVIFDIHYQYLLAGSDIIETNTFGANAFSLEEYALTSYVYDMNLAAAEIARAAVERIEAEDEQRYAFVAGVIGPTGKGLSFSTSTDDLSARSASFDQFVEIYRQQAIALLDGNVDLFLVETVFDTLVAKAALYAIFEEMKERGVSIPVMVSATFSDKSGRTLSGQTLKALVSSLSSYPLFSLGLNCSTGIEEMLPLIEDIAKISPFPISAHPNAGFPDIDGNYTQSATKLAQLMKDPLQEGLLHIVGGCCGTTTHHIQALFDLLKTMPPPKRVPKELSFTLCGLESIEIQTGDFLVVGERANVSGSRKFKRLITQKKYVEALSIIKQQVVDGSHIIDICVDDALIEGEEEMLTLLRALLADPEIARVPIMIDSSNWNVIVTALKELQGRAIVNSISLKDGKELFIEKARYIQSMGAAMVVMLFDEDGQADTYERKCAIAERSYNLLVESGIVHPSSIIFDPNILTIATGMDESATYAKDFLEATRWIKSQYPLVKVSGGLSNLSFSFRSNSYIREAIHAVFLEQGALYGLDMAIINPSTLIDVQDIDSSHYQVIKEALLLTQGDSQKATEELINLAISTQDRKKVEKEVISQHIEESTPEQRLINAIIKGDDSTLKEDLEALYQLEAVEIIEGPLMKGMEEVGALFQNGSLFLPQVVRSARVMKIAVDILSPRLNQVLTAESSKQKVVVFATVKGDVHDIGKNIVALVLRCNNFQVVDLGVMVPPLTILEKAKEYHADIVALSGLITPSLHQMGEVCSLFEKEGMNIPILIGGATTSKKHTALRLAPHYPNKTFYSVDAGSAVSVALQLCSHQKATFVQETEHEYNEIRSGNEKKEGNLIPFSIAIEKRHKKKDSTLFSMNPIIKVEENIEIETLIPFINWHMFIKAWLVPPQSEEAIKLKEDALSLLTKNEVVEVLNSSIKAVYGLFPVKKKDPQTIQILDELGIELQTLTFLRSQTPTREGTCYSLSDYTIDDGFDTIGMFVATSGLHVASLVNKYKEEGDEYSQLLLSLLSDRLAEALSEYLHTQIVDPVWKRSKESSSIRPAIGYPIVRDHQMKKSIFTLLKAYESIGVELTESMAMNPVSSVCGLYVADNKCSYFPLSSISEEQLKYYCHQYGKNEKEVLHYMSVEIEEEKKDGR